MTTCRYFATDPTWPGDFDFSDLEQEPDETVEEPQFESDSEDERETDDSDEDIAF